MKNKLSKTFKRLRQFGKVYTGGVWCNVVYQNPHLKVVSDACSICYDVKTDRTEEECANYIERRIATGHESILEHSNIIIECEFKNTINPLDIYEILTLCRFLNTTIKYDKKTEIYQLIIAGSIRGFKHIIRKNKNPENKIYKAIKQSFFQIHSCYFKDFIDDNIMTKNVFVDMLPNQMIEYPKDKVVNIVNIDNINKIMDELHCSFDEVLDYATITIFVNGISRTASHQLVRHRAGITQKSQRYTDSSNLKFINPCDFKSDKYDKEKEYKINFTEESDTSMYKKADEIGSMLMHIYPQLKEQGMLKEDARSFLPSNVETSLYMTFTLRGILKFLELRTHPAAQAEIRYMAQNLKNQLNELDSRLINYDYLKPEYLKEEEKCKIENDIDEILETYETEEELSK